MLRALALSLVCIVSLGCGRARLVDDPLPDAGDDGSVDALFDAIRLDARAPDAGPGDAGDDAGPGNELARALRCEMDQDLATRAALRHVACNPENTFIQVMESFSANFFAIPEFGLLNLPTGNCGFWQCVGAAESCGAYEECVEAYRCMDFLPARCEGNEVVSCGPFIENRVNCTSFGATCEGDACTTPEGCRFGLDPGVLQCSGDLLTLCGFEETSVDCSASGTSCGEFAVSGEVPVAWCGESVAGAYRIPNACEGTLLIAPLVTGEVLEFDCREFGYRTCTENGCR